MPMGSKELKTERLVFSDLLLKGLKPFHITKGHLRRKE
jgi:hypothetical protein